MAGYGAIYLYNSMQCARERGGLDPWNAILPGGIDQGDSAEIRAFGNHDGDWVKPAAIADCDGVMAWIRNDDRRGPNSLLHSCSCKLSHQSAASSTNLRVAIHVFDFVAEFLIC
jgi:hypothetical protein